MKDLKILSPKLQKELEQIQSSLSSSEASGNHFHTVHILRSELLPFLTKNNEGKRFTKEITLYKKQLREATKRMEGDLKEVRGILSKGCVEFLSEKRRYKDEFHEKSVRFSLTCFSYYH